MNQGKVITVKPDKTTVGQATVRIECSCGWEEKAFKGDADMRIITHNRVKHSGQARIREIV